MTSAHSSRIALLAFGLSAVTTNGCERKQAPPAPPAPPLIAVESAPRPIGWATKADEIGTRVGQTLSIVCPANGEAHTIWGTDLYSSDSSICTAALHSGKVSLESGGRVEIALAPGAASYLASTRNGVTSSSWAEWGGSFTIVGGAAPGLVAVPVDALPPIDWSTDGAAIPSGTVIVCPPNGEADSIWGTDSYTGDSSVCTAAVHAGLVTLELGGAIKVVAGQGAPSFQGSERHGISSGSWDEYPVSFRVERAAP